MATSAGTVGGTGKAASASRPGEVRRLAERFAGLQFGGHGPMTVIYGHSVDDVFAHPDYRVRRIDDVLWELLHAEGYRRIVFHSTALPMYFLDADSRASARPGPASHSLPARAGEMVNDLGGPLGRRVLPGPASRRGQPGPVPTPGHASLPGPVPVGRERPGGAATLGGTRHADAEVPWDMGTPVAGLGDESLVTMLDGFMSSAAVRTAVVFTQAEEWLWHVNARRNLAGVLAGWIGGGAAPGNHCVMVFKQPTLADVHRFVAELRQFPRFEGYLDWSRSGASAAFAVGWPASDELCRIVHRARLGGSNGRGSGNRLVLADWTELPAVTAGMAGERQPASVWSDRLDLLAREKAPLSRAELRRRGWVRPAGSGDGSAREQLAAMPGLATVKEHLDRLTARIAAETELNRRAAGAPEGAAAGIAGGAAAGIAGGAAGGAVGRRSSGSRHLVFVGSPGTGKTTVARLIGELYRDVGLLSIGHLVEAEVSQLIAGHVGQTAINVARVVEEARGGVLFIDEAYRLSDQKDGFGTDAINALVTLLENERDNMVAVVAGYRDPMNTFLDTNEGLRSRFPRRNVIEFPDYSPDELFAILLGELRARRLTWTPETEATLRRVTAGMHARRDKNFANGRTMREFAEDLATEWAYHNGGDVDAPLQPTDLPEAYRALSAEDATRTLPELFAELDSLVGLDEVKELIRDLAADLDMRRRRTAGSAKATGSEQATSGATATPDDLVAPHMLFVGPPGTGKTTVARLIGKIFASLGLLGDGEVHEVTEAHLVGEWMGHTPAKTRRAVRAAIGGVLFIDEAYSLAKPEHWHGGYGDEAIATLLTEMEDLRGRLVVIAAGYPDKMERFLNANPGLRSRFGEQVTFPSYTTAELLEILRRLAGREGFRPTPPAMDKAARQLQAARRRNPAGFGNARAVDTLLERMRRRQSRRLMGTEATGADLNVIEAEDVPDAD